MGVSGVEGVMRRCCEQTLKLLQEQREIIITLLQVLLYDPLFTWSINSTKALRLQSDTSNESSDSTDGKNCFCKFIYKCPSNVRNPDILKGLNA